MTTFSLALGGGGARGLAHIHVLQACDELGVKPVRVAGSSIGAIVGAGYCSGLSAAEIQDFAVAAFARKGALIGRLWSSRPPTFRAFLDDGGPRIGQLNAERTLAAFLPDTLPERIEDLAIPLDVMVTDFYAREELALTDGDLRNALAASAALPAIFRPVRRDGRIVFDGGIFTPLPFDRLAGIGDRVVAVDVNGGPEGDPTVMPSQLDAMIGASQLMMQAVIDSKVKNDPPDCLLRPPVSRYRVMDFLRSARILDETGGFKEKAKRALATLLEMGPRETPHESAAMVVEDDGDLAMARSV